MRILAPAKINLYLEVVGKRSDGFHELRTLMLPLSLCDMITLERTGNGIELDAPECDFPPEDNLAWRAARLFLESSAVNGGVRIGLKKNIPAGTGLGGGSSDAASVLLGLDHLFGTALGQARLMDLAAQLGSDCAFFIQDQALLMGGRGEKVVCPVDVAERAYLLVLPPFGISTPIVYKELKTPLTMRSDGFKIPLLLLPLDETPVLPERFLRNDLEEPAFLLRPELKALKAELLDAGALGAMMSGSGSAVFGVFKDVSHLKNAMCRLNRRQGYIYMPTTRLMGEKRYEYY